MKTNILIFLAFLIIIVGVMVAMWVIEPYGNQEYMIDWDNDNVPLNTGAYSKVTCPVNGHTDNIVFMCPVYEKRIDERVHDIRIRVVVFYYCEEHGMQFTKVPTT